LKLIHLSANNYKFKGRIDYRNVNAISAIIGDVLLEKVSALYDFNAVYVSTTITVQGLSNTTITRKICFEIQKALKEKSNVRVSFGIFSESSSLTVSLKATKRLADMAPSNLLPRNNGIVNADIVPSTWNEVANECVTNYYASLGVCL
jgi:hypothetical protein